LVQKIEEEEDLRVRRTRLMLQEALMALTVEKGFAAITVRDITERAMVNRSTFYRHYLDKYDLLETYTDELYTAIYADEDPMHEDIPGQAPRGLIRFLEHIYTYRDFYRVMLGANGDARFIQHFRQNIENRMRYLLEISGSEIDPSGPPIGMRLSYISCADIGAILWWLENDSQRPPEEFAVILGEMSSSSARLKFGRQRVTTA
jgi:AcrR family transcriptional regulator